MRMPHWIQTARYDVRVVFERDPAAQSVVEVLLASRTDAALHGRISARLQHWNREASAFILRSYQAESGRDEDVLALWDICRVFFRGLLVQKAFASSREENQRLAEAFIELVSGGFRPR